MKTRRERNEREETKRRGIQNLNRSPAEEEKKSIIEGFEKRGVCMSWVWSEPRKRTGREDEKRRAEERSKSRESQTRKEPANKLTEKESR